MKKYAIAIDIGGTSVKIGLVSGNGKILEQIKIPHKIPSRADRVSKDIVKAVRSMNFWQNKNIVRSIKGIGVGVAGDIDQEKGLVRFSANFGWKNAPLKKLLSKGFRLPIIVDNDGDAASWGSYCVEFKRKVNNLICFTLGTGVGGGLIIDRKLFHGATGTAGELGHVTLFPDGVECPCGNKGCLERYVGAYDVIKNVRKKLEAGERSLIMKYAGSRPDKLTPVHIDMAAAKGDKFAIKVWDDAGTALGTVMASMINVLNPEVIVMAGGISGAGKFIMDPIKRTIRERAFEFPAKRVKIAVSKLGKDLGLVGAGCLVLFPSDK